MKLLSALLIAFFSFATFAADIDRELQKLARIQTIVIGEETLEFGFMTGTSTAYYKTAYDNHQLSITKAGYDSFKVEIFLNEDDIVSFEVSEKTTGVVEATKTPVKKDGSYQTPGNNTVYYQTKPTGEAVKIKVEVKTPVIAKANLIEVVTRTGPMDFNPCDGCEHGDQIVVKKVNVVELDLGKYYIGDCEGTFHRLLSQLLVYNTTEEEDGLSVPFTYIGTLNFDNGDYVDQIDNLWSADREKGKLFIGTTTIPVPRFIDSMVYKVATKLNKEAFEVWDDVMEKGQFTSYAKNVLTFKYGNVVIRTDLKTGKEIVE